ncbi:MAG: DUF4350 domain-containing protein [Blastocatellia bacterium]|nr:DUF4350 domain-containing protein [Blastocatellia bacterium]
MKTGSRFALVLGTLLALLPTIGRAQQVPDTEFKPRIEKPAFAEGKGPTVLLDEAHYNFHTASGRYQTFADLLRRDGYVVTGSKELFTRESLGRGQVLVIANALSRRNAQNWNPPIDPSFTADEIKAVRAWVEAGGTLLLIVDHFPMPATAGALAEAFGVRIHNGYAVDPQSRGPLVFKRAEKALLDHPITRGRNDREKIDTVATFTGSAFQIDRGEPILTFTGPEAFAYTPQVFGRPPDKETPRTPIQGWLQGAALRVGKGRVAVFGEAAMFSAQLAGAQKTPMGMNAPIAPQNPQFLLNVMHWLSGLLDK